MPVAVARGHVIASEGGVRVSLGQTWTAFASTTVAARESSASYLPVHSEPALITES